jgi:PAS domain S-box-containing protein
VCVIVKPDAKLLKLILKLTIMNKLFLNEHRCQCNKLLFKGIVFDGALEIKCKRCGEINKIGSIKSEDSPNHYLLIINDYGLISNLNDSACRILGYEREELIGKHFTFINPTMPKEMGEKFFGPKSVLNGKNYLKLDTIHQTKNGKNLPITVLIKLHRSENNARYVLLSAELRNVHVDIEHEKDGEKFVDKACDFYFDLDKAGTAEFMCPAMRNFFGFTSNENIGTNYLNYIPIVIIDEMEKTFKYFSSKKQPYKINDIIIFNSKKEKIHCELYFTPNFNEYSEFIGYRVLGWVKKNVDILLLLLILNFAII